VDEAEASPGSSLGMGEERKEQSALPILGQGQASNSTEAEVTCHPVTSSAPLPAYSESGPVLLGHAVTPPQRQSRESASFSDMPSKLEDTLRRNALPTISPGPLLERSGRDMSSPLPVKITRSGHEGEGMSKHVGRHLLHNALEQRSGPDSGGLTPAVSSRHRAPVVAASSSHHVRFAPERGWAPDLGWDAEPRRRSPNALERALRPAEQLTPVGPTKSSDRHAPTNPVAPTSRLPPSSWRHAAKSRERKQGHVGSRQ